MAQKKKVKKASWLKTALIYTFFPLFIWSLAFVAWLYWDSITAPFSTDKAKERNTLRTTRRWRNLKKVRRQPNVPRKKFSTTTARNSKMF